MTWTESNPIDLIEASSNCLLPTAQRPRFAVGAVGRGEKEPHLLLIEALTKTPASFLRLLPRGRDYLPMGRSQCVARTRRTRGLSSVGSVRRLTSNLPRTHPEAGEARARTGNLTLAGSKRKEEGGSRRPRSSRSAGSRPTQQHQQQEQDPAAHIVRDHAAALPCPVLRAGAGPAGGGLAASALAGGGP